MSFTSIDNHYAPIKSSIMSAQWICKISLQVIIGCQDQLLNPGIRTYCHWTSQILDGSPIQRNSHFQTRTGAQTVAGYQAYAIYLSCVRGGRPYGAEMRVGGDKDSSNVIHID